jgi:hypothetical protein
MAEVQQNPVGIQRAKRNQMKTKQAPKGQELSIFNL